MGHRTQAAPNINRKPAFLLAIDDLSLCNRTEVVNMHQAAGMILAPGERHFKLATKILGVWVTQ